MNLRSILSLLPACMLLVTGCGSAAAQPVGAAPATPAIAATSAARAATSASPVLAATTSAGSGARGFVVASMSFVSHDAGFALGTRACGSSRCLALLATTDGARTWRSLTPPPAGLATARDGACPQGEPCVRQIRFTSATVGYAFDPDLLMTTDGGRHWHRGPGVFTGSLETAASDTVRVVSGLNGCAGGAYRVEVAPSGTDLWRELPSAMLVSNCPPSLYRQGADQLVLVAYGNPAGGVPATATIARSGDGGRHWASGPDSCGRSYGFAGTVALAPPEVVVLLCRHQTSNASGEYGPAWARVSTDAGGSFAAAQVVPSRAVGTYAYELSVADRSRLLVAEQGAHGTLLLLSADAGHTWTSTLSLPVGAPTVLAGYQDARTARVAQGGSVWTTRDGGQSWTASAFGS